MTEKKEIDLEKYENIDLVFDVESEALDREGFAYGYVVTATNKETGEVEEIEAGEMYSIEGAKNAVPWVQENVIPVLPVGAYLEAEATASLPEHIVRTNAEVRQSFFDVMTRWKQAGADIWSDVNWPVEARFMHDTIADGKDYSQPEQMAAAEQKVLNFIDQVLIDGNRENINKENLISAAKQFQSEFNRVGDNMPGKDNPTGRMFAGPFPMKDVSTVIGEVHKGKEASLNRIEYSGLEGARIHNPLDDARASAMTLHKARAELKQKIIQEYLEQQQGTEVETRISNGKAEVKGDLNPGQNLDQKAI